METLHDATDAAVRLAKCEHLPYTILFIDQLYRVRRWYEGDELHPNFVVRIEP